MHIINWKGINRLFYSYWKKSISEKIQRKGGPWGSILMCNICPFWSVYSQALQIVEVVATVTICPPFLSLKDIFLAPVAWQLLWRLPRPCPVLSLCSLCWSHCPIPQDCTSRGCTSSLVSVLPTQHVLPAGLLIIYLIPSRSPVNSSLLLESSLKAELIIEQKPELSFCCLLRK